MHSWLKEYFTVKWWRKGLIAALGIPLCSYGLTLPQASLVPGGVAILPLPTTQTLKPSVTFSGKPVMVLPKENHGWQAVVGIPLSATTGLHCIQVNYGGKSLRVPFTIKAKAYPTQKLTIADERKVTPNKKDQNRISAEKHQLNQYYTHWSPMALDNFRFTQPVPGPYSSSFGSRRILNGKPRSPHTGMDIAAPAGTPIKAPAGGVVLGTGGFFFSGNMVLLDHGQGFMSYYAHMSKITVRPGDRVVPGTVLGLVGATGRVTGPHLHWTVMLNQAKVDPALFLSPAKTAHHLPPPAA